MADKDISRMSLKRLKYRYGESSGADKEAEQELRRRGLSDIKIRGVIYGYRKGEYTPKGGPYEAPVKKRVKKEEPPTELPAEAKESEEPTIKVPIMYYGKFKGRPLAELSKEYLARIYAAFKKNRKHIEKELRSRGCDDEELEYFRNKYRYLGASPEKQNPEGEAPKTKAKTRARKRRTKIENPGQETTAETPKQEPKVEAPAGDAVPQTPKRLRVPQKPPPSSRDKIFEKAEALARAQKKAEELLGEEKEPPMTLKDYVRNRKPK